MICHRGLLDRGKLACCVGFSWGPVRSPLRSDCGAQVSECHRGGGARETGEKTSSYLPPPPPPSEISMLTLLIAFSTFSDFALLLKINDGYCLQEIPSVHRKQMDKLRNTRSP